MKEKESFVFYRSFADSINFLPTNLQLPLYKAITAYALDLEEPDFGNYEDRFVLEALWAGIKPQLDANYQRYLNGCKGGCPPGTKKPSMRGNQNARKRQNQNETETKPNVNDNVNVNDNDLLGESAKPITPTTHRRKFVKPTPEEVREYCREKGFPIDADRFCDHYESNGWVVGKSPMRDWKAAVRTWARKEKDSQGVNTLPQQPGNIIGPNEILKMMNSNG